MVYFSHLQDLVKAGTFIFRIESFCQNMEVINCAYSPDVG